MRMIKRKLNQYGFSLVEIMVAVAIVGILTAIAIPQYQKYQRKSLQNEAKVLLSNMYTIERVFSLNWGYGSTNLRQMGFKARGNLAYNAGWPDGKNPGPCNTNQKDRTAINSSCPGYQGPPVPTSVPCATDSTDLVNVHHICGNNQTPQCDCGHTETTPENIPTTAEVKNNFRKVQFTIGANRKFGNGKQDTWTIDHNKRLKNVKSGL